MVIVGSIIANLIAILVIALILGVSIFYIQFDQIVLADLRQKRSTLNAVHKIALVEHDSALAVLRQVPAQSIAELSQRKQNRKNSDGPFVLQKTGGLFSI